MYPIYVIDNQIKNIAEHFSPLKIGSFFSLKTLSVNFFQFYITNLPLQGVTQPAHDILNV